MGQADNRIKTMVTEMKSSCMSACIQYLQENHGGRTESLFLGICGLVGELAVGLGPSGRACGPGGQEVAEETSRGRQASLGNSRDGSKCSPKAT